MLNITFGAGAASRYGSGSTKYDAALAPQHWYEYWLQQRCIAAVHV
jgi:hypothetical protein